MAANREEIVRKLKAEKPRLQKEFGLSSLALFGSVARKENNTASDIDILVDITKNTSSNFFNIAFTLKDLFHPSKVDVVSRKGIKPGYFNRIENDLIYV